MVLKMNTRIKSLYGIVFYSLSSVVFAGIGGVDSYLSSFSVTQGDNLKFYATSPDSTLNLRVMKYWLPSNASFSERKMAEISDITAYQQAVPTYGWRDGANWSETYSLNTSGWASGIYEYAVYGPSGTDFGGFTVKSVNPGSTSKILLLDHTPTNIAYNDWGGKSLYSADTEGFVSLYRPDQNKIPLHEVEFSRWATMNGIKLEYASMMDLENDPSLLNNYNLVITAGHNEYWSKNMRTNFDNYIKDGGNAMILSGNTMWWQVRFEDDQMIGYKSAASRRDPMVGIDNSIVTDNWASDIVNSPENSSIGVSWRNGGYVNYSGGGGVLLADPNDPNNNNGGYTVTDASHWIYEGTGLKDGDIFGKSTTIVGYETDGAVFFVDGNGNYVVTGEDGTPLNFEILGVAATALPGNNFTGSGHATMGIFEPFEGGGAVFNAATVDWADGLLFEHTSVANPLRGYTDPVVSRITLNLIDHLQYRNNLTIIPIPSAWAMFFPSITSLFLSMRRKKRNIYQ